MTDEVTPEKYQATVDEFNKAKDECDKLKDSVQEGCNLANHWGWMIGEEKIWAARDKMFEYIDKIWKGLKDAAEGLLAPFTFINYAGQWKADIAGAIAPAVTAVTGSQTAATHWEGWGAKAYEAARLDQKNAVTATQTVCKQIGDELMNVANAGWTYYKDLIKSVTGFLTKFYATLGKFGNPINLLSEIENGVKVACDFADAVVGIVLAVTEAFHKQYQQRVNFIAMEIATPGFPNGKWPASAKDAYDNQDETDNWSIAG